MDTINHIHIPRCSGIYIKTHIVNDLKVKGIPYFASNHNEISESKFLNKKFISGHFGMTPLKYRNNLINIGLVRDPVDRFISNFIYMHQGFKGAHLESKLEEWMTNEKQYNLQARSLNKCIDEKLYNSMDHGTLRALDGWCLEDGEIDMSQVKSFIDSMYLIDTMDNHFSFISRVNDLCKSVYGLSSFSNRNYINENFQKISVSDEIRSKIEELNSLDMEVYEYVRSTR